MLTPGYKYLFNLTQIHHTAFKSIIILTEDNFLQGGGGGGGSRPYCQKIALTAFLVLNLFYSFTVVFING